MVFLSLGLNGTEGIKGDPGPKGSKGEMGSQRSNGGSGRKGNHTIISSKCCCICFGDKLKDKKEIVVFLENPED